MEKAQGSSELLKWYKIFNIYEYFPLDWFFHFWTHYVKAINKTAPLSCFLIQNKTIYENPKL